MANRDVRRGKDLANVYESRVAQLEEELRQTKAILKETQYIFETVLEGTMAGYWDWDISANTEYYSPSFRAMFGYEEHEFPNIPDSWQKIIHPEDLPGVLALFNEHVKSRGKVPFDNEVRYIHKDGHIVWVFCRGKVIEWSEDGEPLRMVGSHVDITPLKAQDELERRWSALTDRVNFGIASSKGDSIYIDLVNPAFTKLTGYSREELSSMQFTDLYTEGEAHKSILNAKKANKEGEVNFETVFKTKKGKKVPVSISLSVVHDENGKLLYRMGIVKDISTKKESERVLLQSQERFKSVYEGSLLGIPIVGLNGKFIDANSRFCDLLGYSKEELMALSISDVTHEEDRFETKEMLLKILSGERSDFTIEKRYITKTKDTVWGRTVVSVVKGDNGEPSFLMALVEDITATRKIQRALRESETRNRAILDAIPDIMFTLSADGYYLDYKLEDEGRLIRPVDEIIGAHKTDVLPADVAKLHMECITRSLIEDEVVECKYQLPENDQQFYYEARFMRIGDNQVLQVIRDITKSIVAQNEILAREQQLRMITENINEVVYQLSISEDKVEIDYISPKVIDVIGFSVEDYMNRNPEMAKSLRPGTIEKGAEFNKRVRSAKKPGLFVFTYEFYNPIKREWVWLEEKTVPYFNSEGNIIGQFGTVGDVTERVNRQKQLEEYAHNLEREHHEALRSQSMLLSTQINPHFIFNALNSVQYYILNQEIEPAINFVSEFSTLMRAVLRNSMHLFIPISEELNLLKAYLDLEVLRFNGKFTYDIQVDDEVDEANAQIPPMLLQPYIENAIIHGIGPLENNGEVKLKFSKRHDMLVCVIDDNGVGREKAVGIARLREGDKPKSYGMGITSKKVEILNQITSGGFTINVNDKYEENGEPAGTRVTVVVPWKES